MKASGTSVIRAVISAAEGRADAPKNRALARGTTLRFLLSHFNTRVNEIRKQKCRYALASVKIKYFGVLSI